MSPAQDRQLNQTAYRRLKSEIDRTYPPGRFVGISHGQIVADAATFTDIRNELIGLGKNPVDVLVVQAGVDYPETGIILTQDRAS